MNMQAGVPSASVAASARAMEGMHRLVRLVRLLHEVEREHG
ncbi:MAG TPA: hypothetical protein VHN14_06360 [Kofleriaceae bacterium]|nr:hypothetical protein [Kofleriaceae bacterium]